MKVLELKGLIISGPLRIKTRSPKGFCTYQDNVEIGDTSSRYTGTSTARIASLGRVPHHCTRDIQPLPQALSARPPLTLEAEPAKRLRGFKRKLTGAFETLKSRLRIGVAVSKARGTPGADPADVVFEGLRTGED
ncbi:hypothetical protein GWI33_014331 [Rhynchophorus ferrugineus]|uniref:Uncharacterized protein n=1 Tax=Rhynchophorus ferrugineus TaxID=354439 RepID=A0A834MAS5_RHYFE|nr:hypothetical protein GWI33_014331 [Rhynchophorus ferrugineus]